MIAVSLVGRIGNQLFIYAAAEAIRQKRGRNEKIVFFDHSILDKGWKNSLEDYPLDNVIYEHDYNKRSFVTRMQIYIVKILYKLIGVSNPKRRFAFERKCQTLLNMLGIVACRDGYLPIRTPKTRNVWIMGYFQSKQYFEDIAPMIREKYMYRLPILREKDYVQQLESRNSVCISIKVEHNAGDPLFDVCDKEYYTKAIQYITEYVEKPLFFICSDNVPYVLEHYIDASKYDYICQEKGLSVSDSLAIMGTCKHYVIGNTSFGWWAQFLSANPNKIVVAPNRWYREENMPVDIWSKNWHLIDVTDYITSTKDYYEQQ